MQQNLWRDVLKQLEEKINRPSFNTWLRPTQLVSIRQHNILIGVPNEVFVYWLGEYYVNVIGDVLSKILGFQPDISFVVMNGERMLDHNEKVVDQDTIPEITSDSNLKIGSPASGIPLEEHWVHSDGQSQETSLSHGNNGRVPASGRADIHAMAQSPGIPSLTPGASYAASRALNTKYTFDSYVVGNNNRFAHAAALAVAEQKAINYNPLFIYGGVGLGKTHLLHAIGNCVSQQQRAKRILYLSAEQFVNELIGSIREDRMAGFRDKYRNIDLLLVDDIQFIARKERTQEEFFHTFNTLYHDHKQIVLTSDCPPKRIPTIAEQLRSRFEWGLIADIHSPDLETRIAILRKKADIQNVVLPDEVTIYIASKVKSNIRELEGCLSKIRAYATFNHQEISLELAKRVLHDMFDNKPRKITIELVQQAVANHYHIELDAMKSSGRTRDITLPRQIAMYLARELTDLSLPDIGKNFGGRDHTTVLHACKKVETIQSHDLSMKENLIQIRNLIEA